MEALDPRAGSGPGSARTASPGGFGIGCQRALSPDGERAGCLGLPRPVEGKAGGRAPVCPLGCLCVPGRAPVLSPGASRLPASPARNGPRGGPRRPAGVGPFLRLSAPGPRRQNFALMLAAAGPVKLKPALCPQVVRVCAGQKGPGRLGNLCLARARGGPDPGRQGAIGPSCRTPILRLFLISPRRFGAVLDCRGGQEGRLVYKGFLSGVEMVPTGGRFPC